MVVLVVVYKMGCGSSCESVNDHRPVVVAVVRYVRCFIISCVRHSVEAPGRIPRGCSRLCHAGGAVR